MILLTKVRKEKKMTQQRLSEMTGICRQHISLYECGSRQPGMKLREKIARALNFPDTETLFNPI